MKNQIILTLLTTLALSGCNKAPSNKTDTDTQASATPASSIKNTLNTVKNPCLDPQLISDVKQGILDKAKNLISVKIQGDNQYFVYNLIDNTKLTLGGISEPETDPKSSQKWCNATVLVEYKGNDKTGHNLISEISRIVRNDNLGMFQRGYTEYGINQFNIDELMNVENNSFQYNIKYRSTDTYSEDGTANKGWEAYWGITPNMIATMAFSDALGQLLKKSNEQSKQQDTQPTEQSNQPVQEKQTAESDNTPTADEQKIAEPEVTEDTTEEETASTAQ